MRHITALLYPLAFLSVACFGQRSDSLSKYGIKPNYKWVKCNPMMQKNFYLLSVLAYDKDCRKAVEHDQTLHTLFMHYKQAAEKPTLDCSGIPACYTQNMLWSNADMERAGISLAMLYKSNITFRTAIHRHLRESGVFMKWAGDDDPALLTETWKAEAIGINQVITRYTTNKGFRYPDIDSSAFHVRDATFKNVISKIFNDVAHATDTPLFFFPSLKFAIGLLEANHRNEAARHEPLAVENRSAYSKIAATPWHKYPYAAILVLGEGPEDNKPISEGNMYRCKRGAALYRQGHAPFIIVSGGYVHPFQTPYAEAIEMRKYLVNTCKVPAGVIIVEPQARHTTTNIRNSGRIVLRNSFPENKKILCVSNNFHIASILTSWFSQRNMNELGYLPYAGMKKISDSTLEFSPVVKSLYWDANDPLDP